MSGPCRAELDGHAAQEPSRANGRRGQPGAGRQPIVAAEAGTQSAGNAERTRTGAAILWRTVTRNARLLTSGSLLICGHQLCEAMVPVLIGVLIDRAVKPGDAVQLLIWVGVLAVLFVALTMCYRLGARHLMRAIATEGHQLRIDLAARILDPRRLRTSQRTGELLSDRQYRCRQRVVPAGLHPAHRGRGHRRRGVRNGVAHHRHSARTGGVAGYPASILFVLHFRGTGDHAPRRRTAGGGR